MDVKETRRCYGQCKQILPLECFSAQGKACRECANTYNRARYAQQREKLRAQQNAWRDANRDKHNAYNRKYARANPEKVASKTQEWALANPVRRFAGNALGQARRRGFDVTLTISDVQQMWELQGGRCALSDMQMVPGTGRGWTALSPSLDRKIAGGAYSKENVRIVCYCVNAGRGNMSDEDFIAMCRAVVNQADKV